MEAAEAAMAANAQGKFWQMHDKLFENQQALDRPSLDKYAQEVGLNMAKYKAAMEQHLYNSKIESDSKRGTAVGANGTPTFFINGQLLSGAQPFPAFKSVIDAEIKHADELIKKGTPMDKLYDAELASAKAPPPSPSPSGVQPGEPPTHVEIAAGDSPYKGPKNAPVQIIEFSDFQ